MALPENADEVQRGVVLRYPGFEAPCAETAVMSKHIGKEARRHTGAKNAKTDRALRLRSAKSHR